MSQVQRGFFGSLDKYVNFKEPISIKLICSGENVYDFACFGVDSRSRLVDEGYMIFYNQKASPYRDISVNLLTGMALFNIDLDKVSDGVQKLVSSVSIDGAGCMKNVKEYKAILMQRDKELLEFSCSGGSIFADEKSSVYAELVRSQGRGWDISFVCQGFAGDLGDLVRYFGEEVEENKKEAKASDALELQDGNLPSEKEAANEPAEDPEKGRAESADRGAAAAEKAPTLESVSAASSESAAIPEAELTDYSEAELNRFREGMAERLGRITELQPLAEPLSRSILKHGLKDSRAKVCLAVDGSGSTTGHWLNGRIQDLFNLIVPLAAHFADRIQFDIWFYAKEQLRGETVTAENYRDSIPQVGKKTAGGLDYFALIKQIGTFNDEENAVKALSEAYGSERGPVFIIFVSGGAVKESDNLPVLLKQTENSRIFWQFVGLDKKKNYGILSNSQEFNNSGFFMADGAADMDKEELYDGLLHGFTRWLRRRHI
ncbi:VWA domain-containing protein [bacterium]|nr:VWA domain-containing protein [bacterium]